MKQPNKRTTGQTVKPKEDLAFSALIEQAKNCDGSSLWLLEENWQPTYMPDEKSSIITNRFDIYQRLKNSHQNCFFQDFETLDSTFDFIFIRISKDKFQTHHLLNSAASMLSEHGQMYMAGYDNEGYKSFIKRCKDNGLKVQNTRLKKGAFIAQLSVTNGYQKLDDGNYSTTRKITTNIETIDFYSKPGVYGWKKIDQGSSLLIESLKKYKKSEKHPTPETILDLGCGYGYLSLHALQLFPQAKLTATDNNAAALIACQKNLEHQDDASVVASNAGDCVEQNFQLIVCNPPFHQGFTTEKSLTELFIESSSSHLQKDGEAWFVVNSFIGFEKIAKRHFKYVDMITNDSSYKVIRCKHLPQKTQS